MADLYSNSSRKKPLEIEAWDHLLYNPHYCTEHSAPEELHIGITRIIELLYLMEHYAALADEAAIEIPPQAVGGLSRILRMIRTTLTHDEEECLRCSLVGQTLPRLVDDPDDNRQNP